MDDQGLLLSVVATSRNDDHGANLRRRMQTFATSFINQCKRHDLRAELILVEWNPPADRPRLAEALRWPADPSPCEVRIIEVHEALHRRFAHAEALPLFQMIGKNVGIRRARGRYILATNIDILFNDELMRFLKEGRLEAGKIYRIDRTDVEANVPVDAPVEEQLDYCRSHHLRVNSIHGTFPLSPEGLRIVAAEDVATAESGLVPMEGTSHVERDPQGQVFRWAGGDVYFMATAPQDGPRRLLVELSPGPCVRRLPAEIEVLEGKALVARGRVLGRSVISLALPLAPGEKKVFRMRAVEGGYYPPPMPDTRVLDFALHRLSWSDDGAGCPARSPEDAFKIVTSPLDARGDVVSPASGIRLDWGWHNVQRRAKARYRWADSGASLVLDRHIGTDAGLQLWVGAGPQLQEGHRTTLQIRDEQGRTLGEAPLSVRPHRVHLPVVPGRVFLHVLEDGVPLPGGRAVQAFRLFSCTWADAPLGERLAAATRARVAGLALRTRDVLSGVGRILPRMPWSRKPSDLERTMAKAYTPPRMHTNACGDFTLLAREDWFKLGAYAELELYSLHIDSLLLYAAHSAGLEEVILEPEPRAYHIEHSAGSGWTPEGENSLFERLRAKGIPVLTLDELYEMSHGMETQRNPRLYSSEHWGLANEVLPETRIGSTRGARAA
jgi:hypothetical protein